MLAKYPRCFAAPAPLEPLRTLIHKPDQREMIVDRRSRADRQAETPNHVIRFARSKTFPSASRIVPRSGAAVPDSGSPIPCNGALIPLNGNRNSDTGNRIPASDNPIPLNDKKFS